MTRDLKYRVATRALVLIVMIHELIAIILSNKDLQQGESGKIYLCTFTMKFEIYFSKQVVAFKGAS